MTNFPPNLQELLSLELDSVSGDDYLTAAVEGNALIVRTTDDFEDFEKNQASSVDSVTLVTTIKLKCNEVNELSTLVSTLKVPRIPQPQLNTSCSCSGNRSRM